jgi:hypothetical protein
MELRLSSSEPARARASILLESSTRLAFLLPETASCRGSSSLESPMKFALVSSGIAGDSGACLISHGLVPSKMQIDVCLASLADCVNDTKQLCF